LEDRYRSYRRLVVTEEGLRSVGVAVVPVSGDCSEKRESRWDG